MKTPQEILSSENSPPELRRDGNRTTAPEKYCVRPNTGVIFKKACRINADNSQEEHVRDQLNLGLVPEGIDVHCLAGLIKMADAYINGDFSFVDKEEGLLNFFLILIANRDLNASNSKLKNRGWWTPVFFTAGLSSAKFFMEHVSRQNTLQAANTLVSLCLRSN